jgi:hypothetical protein
MQQLLMNKTRYLTIIFILFCGQTLFAQRAPAWGGGADQNDYSFGFTFQYVSSYFKIDKKTNWQDPYFDQDLNRYATTAVTNIGSNTTPGFAVSFLFRYRISEHLEARTTPGLVFADRTINYSYEDPTQDVSKPVQATMVEFPLSLKLKSDRVDNYRAYVMAGVKYSQAIGAKRNKPDTDPVESLLTNKNGFGSYEVGLGCDIYFEFFKLTPEIKLSNSLGNMLNPENTPYANPINKLSLHTVTFSLCFE